MTPREAAKKLSWYSTTNGCGQCTDDDHKKAKTLAITALKKQVPKKLDFDGRVYDRQKSCIYDISHCPVCKHEFKENTNEWGSAFCQDCGQALDWSENNAD